MRRRGRIRVGVLAVLGAAGCGTTRTTDTQRAASEMLLVSQAVDHAVADLDLSPLAGKAVFLDTQYLDGTVDKGYVISSLRQRLLHDGAFLMDERGRAQYVVEPRAGGVGTDRNSLLVGTPAMSLPAVLPGVPSSLPEVALIKKTDQRGVAKLAVFAYNRQTGRPVWQSGLVEGTSNMRDKWYFGAGPYSTGSIRPKSEFAGDPVPQFHLPSLHARDTDPTTPAPDGVRAAGVLEPRRFPNPDAPSLAPVPLAVLGVVGGLAGDRPLSPPNREVPPAGGPTTPVSAAGR